MAWLTRRSIIGGEHGTIAHFCSSCMSSSLSSLVVRDSPSYRSSVWVWVPWHCWWRRLSRSIAVMVYWDNVLLMPEYAISPCSAEALMEKCRKRGIIPSTLCGQCEEFNGIVCWCFGPTGGAVPKYVSLYMYLHLRVTIPYCRCPVQGPPHQERHEKCAFFILLTIYLWLFSKKVVSLPQKTSIVRPAGIAVAARWQLVGPAVALGMWES